MSIPEDLLDQLLTGYLDDALSADERDRVEQLLQTKPEVADELAQLQDQRESLRAIAEADSAIKLEDGFSDRILDAAVARARAEGLADDHPLIRLAEQPSTTVATTDQSSSWRFAAVLVGLAASIAIAVIALRSDPRDADGFAGVVDPQPGMPQPGMPQPIMAPDQVPEVVEDPGVTTPEMVAASDADGVPPESVVVVPEPVVPEPVVPEPVAPKPEERSSVPVEAVVESTPRVMEKANPPVIDVENLRSPIGAILVLDVRRTPLGRQTNAVQEAMRLAAIELPSKMQITDEIAGFVSDQSQAADADVSVLYLSVQGKSFEKLYNSLWADQDGIASVRMALSLDAPLMKVVSAVRPDPTTIRGSNTVLELVSEDEVVHQFAHQLGQLDFPPMGNRDDLPVSPGADIDAEVLLLVR